MGYVVCSGCKYVGFQWQDDNPKVRNWWVHCPNIMACKWCGQSMKLVTQGYMKLDEHGYLIKPKRQEGITTGGEKNMTIKKENFKAVTAELRMKGYLKEVPEDVLRKTIADKCDTVDKSIITKVMNSMADIGWIRNKAFRIWEITTDE